MAKEHYFDITAKLDMMEMKNAVIMAQKELKTRFDFKGVVAEITLMKQERHFLLALLLILK